MISAKENILAVQRNGISQGEVIDYYSKWAKTYDKDLTEAKWSGPGIMADEVASLIQDKSVRILDCAAGTGMVGEELKRRCFTNIDALDPCEEMLLIAKEKKVYKHFFTEFLGPHKLSIAQDTYDVVTIVGGFTEGHVKPDCIPELTRIVKPGGYIMLGVRDDKLKQANALKNLEDVLNGCLAEGTATTLLKKRHDKYGAGQVLGWLFCLKVAK